MACSAAAAREATAAARGGGRASVSKHACMIEGCFPHGFVVSGRRGVSARAGVGKGERAGSLVGVEGIGRVGERGDRGGETVRRKSTSVVRGVSPYARNTLVYALSSVGIFLIGVVRVTRCHSRPFLARSVWNKERWSFGATKSVENQKQKKNRAVG